jgi:thiol:disulfide interchange protein DsbC
MLTGVVRTLLAVGGVLVVPGAGHAATTAAASGTDGRAEIARRLDVPVSAVRPSAIPGLLEVANGGEVIYVSADGRYAIKGELYDTDRHRNVTEERRNAARSELLKALPDEETIVYSPARPRYSLTVFTDVDCKFCRAMHSEIAEYNRLGIRVRYAFFPREGPGSEAWRKAEAVWCAPNRQDALTRAKQGGELQASKSGCRTPVSRTYELGKTLGMRGTPGIFTAHGDYLAGYLPPAEMLAKLRELETSAAAE